MNRYLSAFLGFCSGIAVFLYGMKLLSRTLEATAGGGKRILDKSPGSPVKGFLLGTGVSALIQSSSAATVAVVGLVNSGILCLSSAYPIIIGANLGTTATSWLTALSEISEKGSYLSFISPQFFAPIVAIISVFTRLFAKKKKARNVSEILLGASFLFIGMDIAGSAFEPLSNTEQAKGLLRLMSDPPFGIFVGILTSGLLQSSSASVGVLQAMSLNTVIPYSAVIPLVMGQNIGTCSSALISSARGNRDSKRAALFHLYYNLAGVLILSPVFYTVTSTKELTFLTRDASSFGIALTHTLFNLISIIILAPFSKYIGRLSEISIRGDASPQNATNLRSELEEDSAPSPSEALLKARREFSTLLSSAMESATLAASMLSSDADENAVLDQLNTRIILAEGSIDKLNDYLMNIDFSRLTSNERIRLSAIKDMLPLLRISFRASIGISEISTKQRNAFVSNGTISKLSSLLGAFRDILYRTVKADVEDDTAAAHRIIPFVEATISALEDMREKCGPLTDLSQNIESILSLCSSVAFSIIRSHLGGSAFEMREYMRSYAVSPEFDSLLREIRAHYSL